MTISNEQIQALQAAAEKATPGEWSYLITTPFMDAEISAANNTRVVNLLSGDVTEANSKFIAAANPAVILSLLAEREADKALIEVYREAYAEAQHMVWVNWEAAASMNVENEERKRRIAELESSHKKLRGSMAAIHNTIRLDGISVSLSVLLSASKRAYEESAAAAGITLVVGGE